MKDEIIMKDGKPHKIVQVVMLPTKEQRWKVGNQHDDRYEFYSFVDKKLYSRQSNAHNWSLSHLYILSSEETRSEECWHYNHILNTISKEMSTGYKKIIATIDESLVITTSIGNQGTSMFTKLPRPSDDFIKAFVKAEGKITQVLVEYDIYEDEEQSYGYKLKVSPDNTITIRPVQEEKIDIIDLAEIELKSYVNPSEEFKDAFIAGVTTGYYHKNKEAIHTWIDKGIDVFSGKKTSWSREEVIRFAEKYARMVQEKPIQLNAYKIIHNNKWIEENL